MSALDRCGQIDLTPALSNLLFVPGVVLTDLMLN